MSTKIDFAKRDAAILYHVALYSLSLKQVISKAFLDGKECGHVLTRLQTQDLIRIHSKAASGRYTFVSVTEKGASKAGLGKERGMLTGNSIDDRLGLTFTCYLDSTSRRVLMTNSEANRLLDTTDSIPKNVDVIAAEEPDGCGLFRVYRPDSVKTAAKGLEGLLQSFEADSALKKAMASRVFGIAVLARNEKLRLKLDSFLKSAKNPLGIRCPFLLALAPGVDELAECMKRTKAAA